MSHHKPSYNAEKFISASHAKQYICTDIHGCKLTFLALLERIGFNKSDQLFILGDYIDRGPDSRGVLDTVIQLKEDGYQLFCLRGNHEQILLEDVAHYSGDMLQHKLLDPTLMEIVGDSGGIISPYHEFLHGLNHYLITGKAVFVHAAINIDAPNPWEDFQSMLWERHAVYDEVIFEHKQIFHGHTPRPLREIEQSIDSQSPIINLDNGCVFSHHPEMGSLLCYELKEQKLYRQPNCE